MDQRISINDLCQAISFNSILYEALNVKLCNIKSAGRAFLKCCKFGLHQKSSGVKKLKVDSKGLKIIHQKKSAAGFGGSPYAQHSSLEPVAIKAGH